jgi:hypothetical protein
MNLLDYFILQHMQLTQLQAKLLKVSGEAGSQEAKVELNLTPRPLKTDSGDGLPAYQVGAQLMCQSGEHNPSGPRFSARVGIVTIYQQVRGEPVDLAQFTANHASLTRQLYPLLQHELRGLLIRLGLEQIHLPYDLAVRVQSLEGGSIQVSGAVH